MDHLLISCVFARQFWFRFLQKVTLQDLSPQPDAHSFLEWWRKTEELTLGLVRKGLNSLIILGAWTLWKHRNRCVFDGVAPSLVACLFFLEHIGELCIIILRRNGLEPKLMKKGECGSWLVPKVYPFLWHSSQLSKGSPRIEKMAADVT
jgi:hypothetical protein